MPDDTQNFEQPAPTDIAADEPSAEMTPDELAEAKRYGRLELYCDLADRALDLAFLAVMAFVFARPLDDWLAGFRLVGQHASLRLAAMFLVVIGLHVCVSFPLSFYSGHVLEHRFGLSRQTVTAWLWRYAKRNGLALAFGLAVFWGLYWLIWLIGAFWWLAAAALFFVVSVLLGQLAPVLILPLFYKIERLNDEVLSSRLARLAEGTGLSIEGIYRMVLSDETSKANAMLAGLGRTRRVLLGDTLLEKFTPDEIEVIFAHEIGHHVARHIPKLILTGVLYSLAGFWLSDRLVAAVVRIEEGAVDYGNFPVWTLPVLMLSITVFSLVFEPLANIISRRFERQCDRYALERTGKKSAYVSAFRKLARLNKDDPAPHPLAVFLLHSHPPIFERLAMADSVMPHGDH